MQIDSKVGEREGNASPKNCELYVKHTVAF